MAKLIHSRFLKMGIALAIIAALVCGIALPAMANGSSTPTTSTSDSAKITVIKGKVTSVDENKAFFIVQPSEGDPVTINVDSNTKYFKVNSTPAVTTDLKQKLQDRLQARKNTTQAPKVNTANRFGDRGPGNKAPAPSHVTSPANAQDTDLNTGDQEADPEDSDVMEECLNANCEQPQGFFGKIKSWFSRGPKFGQNAAFEDIAVGDGIVARVMSDEDLAKYVLIIKPAAIKTVYGEITDITDDSFTIQPSAASAEPVTLKWTEKTVVTIRGDITLKTGQNATVVYKVDGLTANFVTVFPRPAAPPATTEAAETE